MPKQNKYDDTDIYINSGKPTEEDLRVIREAIAASKKRLALRDKRKKARQSAHAVKAK